MFDLSLTKETPPLFRQLMEDSTDGLFGMTQTALLTLACYFAKYSNNRQESNHVLYQATNGVAKSHLAENINRALLGKTLVDFYKQHGRRVALRRVQGTPDLTPSDLVGADMLGDDRKVQFRPGVLTAPYPPTSMVLGDELNRVSPRTQAAWLQPMAEGVCTVRSLDLEEPTLPFAPGWLLGTQNPARHLGASPLPEAMYDRFMVFLIIGMTSKLEDMIKSKGPKPSNAATKDWGEPARVEELKLFNARRAELDAELKNVVNVSLRDDVPKFIADVCYWTWPLDAVRRLRLGIEEKVSMHTRVKKAVEPLAQGVSPRAAKALRDLGCAVAWALGREEVEVDLLAELAVPCLSHRLVLKNPTSVGPDGSTDSIIREIVEHARRR